VKIRLSPVKGSANKQVFRRMRGWPVSPLGAVSFNNHHKRKVGTIESMAYELLMVSVAEMPILKNFNFHA